MKKFFLYVCFGVLALTMGSCRGPQGEPGRDGIDGYVNRRIIDLDIPANGWVYTDPYNEYINNYFYAEFNVPELTWDIYDDGLIKVYREYDTGTNNATQIELPYTRYSEIVVDEANFERYFYQEHVDYEFTQGKLTIYYTASDFNYETDLQFVPDPMHFRLVILW